MTTQNTSNMPTLTADGELLIGSAGQRPVAANLLGSGNIEITDGPGSIEVALNPVPGLNLVNSIGNNASDPDVAVLALENIFDDTYDQYVIQIRALTPDTDNVDLYMQFGTGATPTYQTSNYHWIGYAGLGHGSVDEATSQSEINLNCENGVANQLDRSTAGRYAAWMVLSNARDIAQYTSICWKHMFINENNETLVGMGAGFWMDNTVLTSIRLLMSSGDIDFGTMTVYGVSNYG